MRTLNGSCLTVQYRFVAHSYVLPGLGELLLRELTVAAVDRLLTTVTADHGPVAAKST